MEECTTIWQKNILHSATVGGGRPARRGRQCRARCPTPPAWGKQGQQIGAAPFSPNHAVGVITPSNAVYNACHSTRLRAESSNTRKMTEWGTGVSPALGRRSRVTPKSRPSEKKAARPDESERAAKVYIQRIFRRPTARRGLRSGRPACGIRRTSYEASRHQPRPSRPRCQGPARTSPEVATGQPQAAGQEPKRSSGYSRRSMGKDQRTRSYPARSTRAYWV